MWSLGVGVVGMVDDRMNAGVTACCLIGWIVDTSGGINPVDIVVFFTSSDADKTFCFDWYRVKNDDFVLGDEGGIATCCPTM